VAECESEVLVEEVLEELAHADVRPAAVDEQQALEEAELSQGVVARHHRLHALLTTDAHSDVCHYRYTRKITAQVSDKVNLMRLPVSLLLTLLRPDELFPDSHANLYKWGLAQSPSCDCGQRQI